MTDKGNEKFAARMDAMYAAWHVWRAEIVREMAARVAEVGNEPDDDLADLQVEMDHCSDVAELLFGPELAEADRKAEQARGPLPPARRGR